MRLQVGSEHPHEVVLVPLTYLVEAQVDCEDVESEPVQFDQAKTVLLVMKERGSLLTILEYLHEAAAIKCQGCQLAELQERLQYDVTVSHRSELGSLDGITVIPKSPLITNNLLELVYLPQRGVVRRTDEVLTSVREVSKPLFLVEVASNCPEFLPYLLLLEQFNHFLGVQDELRHLRLFLGT